MSGKRASSESESESGAGFLLKLEKNIAVKYQSEAAILLLYAKLV